MSGEVDLVVVGARPAGLAAAARAARGGVRVVLVDAGSEVGGQYWRRPPAGSEVHTEDLQHGVGTFRRLAALLGATDDRAPGATSWRAVSRGGGEVEVRLQTEVWALDRGPSGWRVHVTSRDGRTVGVVEASHVLIATGAHDRVLPFPGWDLPGSTTPGALQALLKGSGVLGGRRVVLGGTGPFLLAVAAGLASRGAQVTVAEAGDGAGWLRELPAVAAAPGKGFEATQLAAALVRHRVSIRPRTVVLRAHGTTHVVGVDLAHTDRAGSPDTATTRTVDADAVGVGWGFAPDLGLALGLGCATRRGVDGLLAVAVDGWQRTSVSGVSAAGETCGVGGADLAVAEGELAALGVLAALGRTPGGGEATSVRRRVARLRRFADALARSHPVPTGWADHVEDSTVLCRCEEVPVGRLRGLLDAPGTDPRTAKHTTRVGMGWCQGRMCGEAVARLCGAEPTPTERLVGAPVTLGRLADQDPNSAM